MRNLIIELFKGIFGLATCSYNGESKVFNYLLAIVCVFPAIGLLFEGVGYTGGTIILLVMVSYIIITRNKRK